MTRKTIRVAADQTQLTGRLASNSAQGCHLVKVQSFTMVVLTSPIGIEKVTLSEEMIIVAEFAALQVDEVLLRKFERRIHTLASSVSQHLP